MREKAGLKKIWGILILFLLVLLPGQIASAKEIKPVKIDEKHFPDENFRWEISESFDQNQDGILSRKEIRKAKELDVVNYDTLKPYLNFSGVEHLPYIKAVGIFGYKIKQRDLNKYPFTKAKKISLDNNYMKSMDFSSCKELEELECSQYHVLKKINVKKNKKLKKLKLENCQQLKDITIPKNGKLKEFWLDENHVQREITLRGVKSLKFLRISRTQITGLKVINCPQLQLVSLISSPNATTLDIQNCPSVSSISVGKALSELYVSHKNALKKLDIVRENLQIEDLLEYKNLEILGVHDGKMVEFNANPWKKLKELSVNGCSSLQRLDVSGLDDLEYLNADGTFLTSLDLSGKIELKELVCANRYLEELNLTGIDNLRKVLAYGVLHKNPLKKIILDADVSKKDLEYIQRQQEWADFDPPELIYV